MQFEDLVSLLTIYVLFADDIKLLTTTKEVGKLVYNQGWAYWEPNLRACVCR